MESLIIRVSKQGKNIILKCNQEKVYTVFKDGKAVFNGLDYDEVSDYFDLVEKGVL